MIGGIVSAIGKVAGSAARVSGEAMPIVQRAPEIATKIPEAAVNLPKPPAAEVLARIGRIESSAFNKGPTGIHEGLRSIANGLNEVPFAEKDEKNDGTKNAEKSDEEKLREELENQRKQQKKKELIDTIAEGLQSPDTGPTEPVQGIISKTIEEAPEAVGEKPENLPREAP